MALAPASTRRFWPPSRAANGPKHARFGAWDAMLDFLDREVADPDRSLVNTWHTDSFIRRSGVTNEIEQNRLTIMRGVVGIAGTTE